MGRKLELCIRDKNKRIVGYPVGYSDDELSLLLSRHKDEGWYMSHVEYTDIGLR